MLEEEAVADVCFPSHPPGWACNLGTHPRWVSTRGLLDSSGRQRLPIISTLSSKGKIFGTGEPYAVVLLAPENIEKRIGEAWFFFGLGRSCQNVTGV